MSIKIYLNCGNEHKCISVSKYSVINDETFDSDNDVLDYLLANIEIAFMFKISNPNSLHAKYVFTSHICMISVD